VHVLVRLHVAKNDNVTVVNGLSLVTVLVSGLYDEAHHFAALIVEFDQIAGLINLSAVFTSL
jgi:hypothetical protein